MKNSIFAAVSTAFAFAFFFFLVLPLQSYLANATAFGASLPEFCAVYCPRATIVCGVVAVVLSFLPRRLSDVLEALLLALTLAAIIESGPLALGQPEMDGSLTGYLVRTRMLWDSAVLLVLVLPPVLCFRRIRGYVPWIAAALVVYSAATVCDVRKEEGGKTNLVIRKTRELSARDGYAVPELMPRADVIRSVSYSAERNVLLLIFDSASADFIAEAFESAPELRSRFTGFVNYANNVGMHWSTVVAVPAILTGRYYRNSSELQEYGQSHFKTNSVVCPYLRRDVPVFLNPGSGMLGYTNRLRDGEPAKKVDALRMGGDFAWSVDELSVFRALPYALKAEWLSYVMTRWNDDGNNIAADSYLWPTLAKMGVRQDWPLTLQVHHSRGTHPPIRCDRNGRPKSCARPSKSDLADEAVYYLGFLAEFMDALREKGIYRRSLIVITGDHGIGTTERGVNAKGVPERAFPFLMVKAAGREDEPFENSRLPTSHRGIAPLLKAAIDGDLNREDTEKFLFSERRLARNLRKGSIYDWIVLPNGAVETSVRQDRQMDQKALRALEIGTTYCFSPSNAGGKAPDFILDGGRRTSSRLGVTCTGGKAAVLTFRAPEPNGAYDLLIRFFPKEGRNWNFTSGGTSQRIRFGRMGDYEAETLRNIRSDADGFIRIEVAAAKKKSILVVSELTLSESQGR